MAFWRWSFLKTEPFENDDVADHSISRWAITLIIADNKVGVSFVIKLSSLINDVPKEAEQRWKTFSSMMAAAIMKTDLFETESFESALV